MVSVLSTVVGSSCVCEALCSVGAVRGGYLFKSTERSPSSNSHT